MTTLRHPPRCFHCERLTGVQRCEAFDGLIPDAIWGLGERHDESIAGETLLFVMRPGVPEEVDEAWETGAAFTRWDVAQDLLEQ